MLNRQRVITDCYLLFVFCLSHRLPNLNQSLLKPDVRWNSDNKEKPESIA